MDRRNTRLRAFRAWRLLPLAAFIAVSVITIGATTASAVRTVSFTILVAGDLAAGTDGSIKLSGSAASTLTGLSTAAYAASGGFTGPALDSLTETLGATKGDSITFACNQVLQPILTQVGPGYFLGTDSSTVTGGTGRYLGASGSATGYTTVNLNTNKFLKYISGTVSY